MILGKKDLTKIQRSLTEISPQPWSGRAGGRIQDADGVPVVSALHTTAADARFIQQAPTTVKNLLDTVTTLRNIIIDIGGNPETQAKFNYNEKNLKLAGRLHNEDGLSLRQVAIELGCDRKTLARQMETGGYTVRSQKESQAVRRNSEKYLAVLTKEEALELSGSLLRGGKK